MLPIPEIPEPVTKALHNALEMGYFTTTRNETGRFMATLAAGVHGAIGECETGSGAGAAWLRLGARKRTRLSVTNQIPRSAPELARSWLTSISRSSRHLG